MFLRKLFRFVPRSSLRSALRHLNHGDFETAAELLDSVLQDSETPAEDVTMYACEAHLEWSKSLAERGELGRAVTAAQRAAQLRPRYADVQCHLGRLHEKSAQHVEARAAYERALEINPRYLEARVCLSRLLMETTDGPQALEHLKLAAQNSPGPAARQIEDLLDAFGDDSEAPPERQRFETIVGKLPVPAPAPREGLAWARQALRDGDNRRAIVELKKLVRQAPDFPDLHNLLGVAYDNEEMVDDAIEEFEQALHLNRDFLDARLNLGLTLFGRGRYDEAEFHLREVERTQPGNQLVGSVLNQIEARGSIH